MRVTQKDHDDVQVLELSGDVDVFSGERLRARAVPLIKAGHRLLLLDLSGVNYLDSSGLAVLLNLWELCQAAGGRLCLCGVGARIRRVFQITQVEVLIPIFPGQREALTYLLFASAVKTPEPRRILVYSNDESTLAEMLRILSAMGHTEIVSTGDAAGARQALIHAQLDLVVIDLWSRMTGVQRLFLNLTGPNRNVPVIVTGLGTPHASGGASASAPSRYEIRRFKTLVSSALAGHEISFIDVLARRLRLAGEAGRGRDKPDGIAEKKR